MDTYIPILIISCVSLIASFAFFIKKIKKCRSGCCEVTTSTTRENSLEVNRNEQVLHEVVSAIALGRSPQPSPFTVRVDKLEDNSSTTV